MYNTCMCECRCSSRTLLTINQWLQSERQVDIFDNYLAHCDPTFVQQLSPLVSISVGAAVTSSLEKNVSERLTWLENVFATLNPRVSGFYPLSPFINLIFDRTPKSKM